MQINQSQIPLPTNDEALEKAKASLQAMGVPLITAPEDIVEIVNASAESISCIDDIDVANAIQFKLGQFGLYLEQQARIVNAAINILDDEYSNRLTRQAALVTPKTLSLAEKKAIALGQDEELQTLHNRVQNLKTLRILLEGWGSHLQVLVDVMKQIHFRIRYGA